ncbi:cytochrome c oxidase subunit 5A, mitochondrial-like [Hydra vulgaris]|uniref:Cytochrome c oxidase subunit 5A, mitochondrial n=1 Tax=Hydra vulgaris TaxID=6087 RepID=A0ABM4DF48_HYDVU
MIKCAFLSQGRSQVLKILRGKGVPAVVTCRQSSSHHESDEAFDARWETYFQRPSLDGWELRRGMNNLYGYDLVPEPKIIIAALKACRRLDDFAMSVRILEMVREKAAGDKEIISFINNQLKGTLDELGISTPEELSLN